MCAWGKEGGRGGAREGAAEGGRGGGGCLGAYVWEGHRIGDMGSAPAPMHVPVCVKPVDMGSAAAPAPALVHVCVCVCECVVRPCRTSQTRSKWCRVWQLQLVP